MKIIIFLLSICISALPPNMLKHSWIPETINGRAVDAEQFHKFFKDLEIELSINPSRRMIKSIDSRKSVQKVQTIYTRQMAEKFKMGFAAKLRRLEKKFDMIETPDPLQIFYLHNVQQDLKNFNTVKPDLQDIRNIRAAMELLVEAIQMSRIL
jgi:hypothetical protein